MNSLTHEKWQKKWQSRVGSLTPLFDSLEPWLRLKTGSMILVTIGPGLEPVL